MRNRIFSLLGIAAKAGKIQSGEFASEKAIKNEKAFLIVVAEDASLNTTKHFKDMCSYRNVPVFVYGTKEELGRCTGKQYRAVLAVTDEGLGNTLISGLKEDNE